MWFILFTQFHYIFAYNILKALFLFIYLWMNWMMLSQRGNHKNGKKKIIEIACFMTFHSNTIDRKKEEKTFNWFKWVWFKMEEEETNEYIDRTFWFLFVCVLRIFNSICTSHLAFLSLSFLPFSWFHFVLSCTFLMLLAYC